MENRIIIQEFKEKGFTGRVDFDEEQISVSGKGMDAIEIPLLQYDDFAEFVSSLKYALEYR